MKAASFEDWKFCIEKKCGIELSAAFVEQRLSVLRNENSSYTREFIRLYGNDHYLNIVGWFEFAAISNNISKA
ncbi:MAG TPA: hypothetical protein PKE07_01900 [Lacibacter sp.]|nr:hypothetical protein [Lacibacter sp.]HMO87947.1 hypothetical protein [Lacibacter sp.]